MIALSLFYFLLYLEVSVISMFFPLLLLHNGFSTTQIGLIIGSGSIISIIASPFWGYISDKTKTIKYVLLLILTLTLIVSAGLFTYHSFVIILLFMLMHMFLKTPSLALLDSLSVMSIKNYGSVRMWGSFGLAIGAVVIGFMIENIGIQSLGFIYFSIMITVIVSIFFLKDAKRVQVPITRHSLKKVFANRYFLWFLFICLLLAIPHKMNERMLSIYLSGIGASESQVGLAWMIATLSAVPVYGLMAVIIRWINGLSLIFITAILFSIRWLCYSIIDDPVVLAYLQMTNGITFPLFFVASIYYVKTIIPNEMGVTGQAVFAAVINGLAGFIGIFGGGWGMDHVSPQFVYQSGSILALAGGIATLSTIVYQRKREKSMTNNNEVKYAE